MDYILLIYEIPRIQYTSISFLQSDLTSLLELYTAKSLNFERRFFALDPCNWTPENFFIPYPPLCIGMCLHLKVFFLVCSFVPLLISLFYEKMITYIC